MYDIVFHRRFWGKAAIPLLVFLLARFLIVVGIPYPGYMPAVSFSKSSSSLFKSAQSHPARIHSRSKARESISKTVTSEIAIASPEMTVIPTGLSLKSSLREYNYVFTGDVSCGENPCQAEVRFSVETDHNPDVKKIITTNADGHFEYRLTFKENLQGLFDWRVMVYTPRTYPIELHGRQILTDDTDIQIQRTIRLP